MFNVNIFPPNMNNLLVFFILVIYNGGISFVFCCERRRFHHWIIMDHTVMLNCLKVIKYISSIC